MVVVWRWLAGEARDSWEDSAGPGPVWHLAGSSNPVPSGRPDWSQMERSLEASRGRKRLCLRLPGEGESLMNRERPWTALVEDREIEAKGSLVPTHVSVTFLGDLPLG